MNWIARTLHPLWILGVLHTTAVFGQAETGLIAHWRFAPEHQLGNKVKPLFGGPDVTFDGPVRFTKDPLPPRVELPGQNESLRVAEDLSKALLPVRDMSAEAWVRVDRPMRWGGILTVIQDNGEFERGWVLGFVNSNFSFGLASETARKLTYTTAAAPFETNRWFHVIGTYDGTNQLLYVNGEIAGQSREQAGNLLYPPKAPVVIGAYQDDDEHHRLVGAIHEVRLYRRALAPDEIKTRYEKRRGDFPEPAPTPKRLELAYGPFVDWRDRSSAVVTWETDEPMPTRLELEAPLGAKRVLGSGMVSKRHEVRMTDLRPNLEHGYRIVGPSTDGVGLQSRRYVFDSSFYYEPVIAPGAETARTMSSTFEIAQCILKQTGVRDGYCLVLGATDGGLAVELVRQSRLDVVVIDSDATRVAAARKTLDQAGIYGVRASVHLAENAELPYGDLVANLIVSESALVSGAPPPFGASEVSRLLRPVGGSLVMGSSNAGARSQRAKWVTWLKAGKLESATFSDRDGLWIHLERGRLEGAGEWSHQYGSTDNTSCSQDDLVQGELQVAWWGDPGPRPMPDRGNRNPAPLSVNGRLFVQGNRILFGLDAYNGAILWSLSAPEVRRANVTRDCSNMAAAGNRLYVAHGRYCLGIDGQTGERRHRFEVVENTSPGAFEWGFVAASNEWLIGSRQKKDAHYLGDDGEWYEDYSPEQISRVTSDRLFSLDPESGAVRWTYRGGVILNSTITIADGMVLFLESRNPEAMAAPSNRLSHEQLTDQYLVALDLRTGKQLWDKGHDLSACQFMTYLVYSQNTAIITGTDKDKKYHTFAFSAPAPNRPGGDDLESAIPGRLLWSDVHKEDKGHHSGHLQHPLVVGTAFYSDQRSFDLTTGKLLRTDLPERRGCGVMSAAKNSIFFRHYFHGMWDLTTNKRSQFEGIRTGCWLGLIPAGGMLLAPESSAGCSCTHAIQTSVGYVPKSLVKR